MSRTSKFASARLNYGTGEVEGKDFPASFPISAEFFCPLKEVPFYLQAVSSGCRLCGLLKRPRSFVSVCPEARITLVEILGAVFATLEPHRVRGPGRCGEYGQPPVVFFFPKPSSSFLADMKHDGISVLHGFAWEGGILEQVGTSTFKPGRGRDDEHFLNLTI